MASKAAPRGLGRHGRRLWRSVLDQYELAEHELAVLRIACRSVDRLEDIADALAGEKLVAVNAKGDQIPHPMLVEQRMQGLALTRLLASLRMPEEVTEEGELTRPQRRGASRGAYGIRGIA